MKKSEKYFNAGFFLNRARYCIRERSFVEGWMELNRNYYGNFLQILFNRCDSIFDLNWKPARLAITARDRFVIATFVQWLGTNNGFGFLQDVLEMIGYELKPTAKRRNREYYEPFKSEQNASAWYNLTAKENQREPIAPLIKIYPKPRKHLFRYYKNSFGKKVCIRCGTVRSSYQSKLPPPCVPPEQGKGKPRILRIKDLRTN